MTLRPLRFTVAALLVASTASADPFALFGFGPRSSSMGGAQVAAGDDYASTFYNPSLLGGAKRTSIGLYFNYMTMLSDVRTTNTSRPLDCLYCKAPDSAGFGLGAQFAFDGKAKERVGLGVGVYFPTSHMVRLLVPDPKRPYWYHYNGNPTRLAMYASLGVKIIDQISVGAGAQVFADLIAKHTDVAVDLFSKEVKGRELDAGLFTRVAPLLGLTIAPIKQLRFGVTYRGEMKLIFEIPASVDLEGIGALGFVVKGIAHYTPHTIQFGAAFDVDEKLTLALDGEWGLWSLAPNPYMGVVIDLSGKTLTALGLDKALDLQSIDQKAGFVDTLNVRAGLEWKAHERFKLRVGGYVRPTPVPNQKVVGTNLMDSTTVGATVGGDVNFDDPLKLFGHPLHLDFTGHFGFVLPRDAAKDLTDAFEVVPPYTFSATLIGVQAGLKYEF